MGGMYDQTGILSVGKKNRVFEIHNRSAAVFRGQHNPVFGHLPGDLAGNRIRLFHGSAMVILRAGVKPSAITLTVSAAGKKDYKLKLNTRQ